MMILGLLNWSTVQSGYAANAADEPQTEWRFLSDIDWVSATHGDAYKHKEVQKNQPFTKGNEGFPDKISLKMPGGKTRVFEKGLGTIADISAHPSVITYDLRGAAATRLQSYIGIDRTAGHPDLNHANVEKIEFLVDGVVKHSSQNILYETEAIFVDFEIPANAQKLEIKAFAGAQTWADEVVYTDIKVKATGKFMTPEDDGFGEFEEQGNAWEPQPQPEPDNSVLLPYVPEAASSDSDTTVINEEEIALSAPQEGKFKELTDKMEDKADVDAIRKRLRGRNIWRWQRNHRQRVPYSFGKSGRLAGHPESRRRLV